MEEKQKAGQMRLDLTRSDVWERLPDAPKEQALKLCASMILWMALTQEGRENDEP